MRRRVLAGLGLACVASTAAMASEQAATSAASAPAAADPVPASAPAAADKPRVTYVFRGHMPAFQDKTVGATALTAGLGSLGGLAGAAVVGAASGALTSDSGATAANAFPNPENLIGADVARRIGPTLGAIPVDGPARLDDAKLEGSRARKYAQLAGESRYLVDAQSMIFRTVWASYATWPLDFKHYIVEYMGKVTVFDTKDSKELFSGRCFVFTKRTPNLPTHDELFANNGAILKTFISQAADDCVAQLREKNEQFRALAGAPAAAN